MSEAGEITKLRQMLKQQDPCIVRLHCFESGRSVSVRSKRTRDGRITHVIHVANLRTGFLWSDGIGYPDASECELVAQELFGFDDWNMI